MTRIWALREGGRYRLTAQGHADGSAQVCAAASALMCALAGALEKLEQEGEARVEQLHLDSGQARVAFSGGERARGAFETVRTGLELLSEQYPELVRLEEG